MGSLVEKYVCRSHRIWNLPQHDQKHVLSNRVYLNLKILEGGVRYGFWKFGTETYPSEGLWGGHGGLSLSKADFLLSSPENSPSMISHFFSSI